MLRALGSRERARTFRGPGRATGQGWELAAAWAGAAPSGCHKRQFCSGESRSKLLNGWHVQHVTRTRLPAQVMAVIDQQKGIKLRLQSAAPGSILIERFMGPK
eukprot:scaffold172711_cov15-Tisochrysis_lutea.AAC.1